MQIFAAAYTQLDTVQRWDSWTAQRDAWLAEQTSPHTRRAYTAAWDAFFSWCRLAPWEVTTDHARAWRDHLLADGKAPTTVGHRLTVLSSFYAWAIESRRMVDGREVSFFQDAVGVTRSNPFHISRPPIKRWEKANPLTPELVNRLLARINTRHLTGARNYALLLTYLFTGYRNSEVRSMTWGNLQPHPSTPDAWLYRWAGKGGKSKTDPFPAHAVAAIRHYLDLDGRLTAMQPADHIWQPLPAPGLANLRNVDPSRLDPARCISASQVVAILRACLRAAGLTPAQAAAYTIHDLRHTFCVEHYREFKDLVALRDLSHHSSLTSLSIYVIHSTDQPLDTHSPRLMARFGVPPRA